MQDEFKEVIIDPIFSCDAIQQAISAIRLTMGAAPSALLFGRALRHNPATNWQTGTIYPFRRARLYVTLCLALPHWLRPELGGD
jgi:hypothetical protein